MNGVKAAPPNDQPSRRASIPAGRQSESSATPDRYLSVLSPDGHKHMISVGLGVRVWKLRVDLAYAHVFMPDRTVSGSEVMQTNPVRPTLAVPVGNGRYFMGTDILAAGVNGTF